MPMQAAPKPPIWMRARITQRPKTEKVSAVSTTGLSAAGTGTLRRSSQILLMPLMYLGRVGPLTLATALIRRERDGARNRVHFPEEKIMIG